MKPTVRSLVCALSLGCLSEGGTLAQDAGVSSQGKVDHSNAIWSALFRSGSKSRSETFLLDKMSLSNSRQVLGRTEEQAAEWTLGIGEDSAHFASGSASNRYQKTFKEHRVGLNLGLNASLFVKSTAFQDLEAQYLLFQADPNGTNLPGRSIDRSLEWGTVIGVDDTYRASPSLDLKLNAEARQNRFEFDATRRETSELLSAGAGFAKRWQRFTWDTDAQRYQLVFRDQQGGGKRQQGLASVSSNVSTPLAGRLRFGLGYQSYTSTFTESDDRSIHGPAVSLARQSDGRFAWEARLSLLRETGNSEREGQSFGSLNMSWRLSPRSNLVLIVSKEVDLLRYYQSYTADRLVLDSEQRYTLLQSLQWDLLSGRSRWSILYTRSEQRFAGLLVENASVTSSVFWKLSRISELTQELNLRRDQEGETLDQSGGRDVFRAVHAYRYSWGGGSRLQGSRPYAALALEYERLRDREIKRTFDRFSLLLSLGQEWLL